MSNLLAFSQFLRHFADGIKESANDLANLPDPKTKKPLLKATHDELTDTFYESTHEHINKHLKHKLELSQIQESSQLKTKSTKGNVKTEHLTKVTFRSTDRGRVTLRRFPHRVRYRDPKRQQPNSIHWGAHERFPRYAVTKLTIFGRNYTSGKRGTKFQGLGFEPMGVKSIKQASDHPSKYRFFIRKQYPSRPRRNDSPRERNHITIKGDKVSYPVYVEFFKSGKDKDVWKDMNKKLEKQKLKYYDAIGAHFKALRGKFHDLD